MKSVLSYTLVFALAILVSLSVPRASHAAYTFSSPLDLVASVADIAATNVARGMIVVGNSAIQAMSFEAIQLFIPETVNNAAAHFNCAVDKALGRTPEPVCLTS